MEGSDVKAVAKYITSGKCKNIFLMVTIYHSVSYYAQQTDGLHHYCNQLGAGENYIISALNPLT
jgi:hypothetical protein